MIGSMEPSNLTASEAARAIARGELTSEALLQSCLEQIYKLDEEVKAFAHVADVSALETARKLDQLSSKGALHGIPFAAKDIIDSHDMPTSYGSAIYANAQPVTDASCIALARRSGGVLLGKTVTTEFANLTPNETRNPIDTNRTPGGSSSGSAAAVAAGMVPVAFGTQTTQSTIRPAAFCGVHGYNPTTGHFRMSGVREAAGTFDRLGLITRSLEDIQLVRDLLLLRPANTFKISPKPPRIAFCRSHLWNEVDGFYRSEIETAIKQLRIAGASVKEIELPSEFKSLPEAHRWISSFEFARNFAFEIDVHWEKISPQLREGRIADGLSCTPEHYFESLAFMRSAMTMIPALFDETDVIVTASTLSSAPIGIEATGSAAIGSIWTPLHLPCVTLPVFKTPEGLPLGLQVLGPLHGDDKLLPNAAWIEHSL